MFMIFEMKEVENNRSNGRDIRMAEVLSEQFEKYLRAIAFI